MKVLITLLLKFMDFLQRDMQIDRLQTMTRRKNVGR